MSGLEAQGDDTIAFEAITTGNFGGFDVWLENWEGASLDLVTNQGTLNAHFPGLGWKIPPWRAADWKNS